jgi:hypothetical protein
MNEELTRADSDVKGKIMSWNYRIIELPGNGDGPIQGVHEVYYDEAGALKFYTSEPVPVCWETSEGPEAANTIINMMLEALNKPVLKPEDFPSGAI